MSAMREDARRLTTALFKIDEVYFANAQKNATKESELCLMYALDDGGPHSQRQIAEEWLIPKTTLNTIVKQWEREGLLTLSSMPGKRREMRVSLTEAGRACAKRSLRPVYQAEELALAKTMARYSNEFVEAVEFFGQALKDAFDSAAAPAAAEEGCGGPAAGV